MNILFTVFFYFSAVGLLGGIFVHIMTIMGMPLPLPENIITLPLTLGVLLTGLVAVLGVRALAGQNKNEDIVRLILSRCPRWLLSTVLFFAAYEILFLIAGNKIDFLRAAMANPNSSALLTLSIVWMSVYSAAIAVLHAVTRSE